MTAAITRLAELNALLAAEGITGTRVEFVARHELALDGRVLLRPNDSASSVTPSTLGNLFAIGREGNVVYCISVPASVEGITTRVRTPLLTVQTLRRSTWMIHKRRQTPAQIAGLDDMFESAGLPMFGS